MGHRTEAGSFMRINVKTPGPDHYKAKDSVEVKRVSKKDDAGFGSSGHLDHSRKP